MGQTVEAARGPKITNKVGSRVTPIGSFLTWFDRCISISSTAMRISAALWWVFMARLFLKQQRTSVLLLLEKRALVIKNLPSTESSTTSWSRAVTLQNMMAPEESQSMVTSSRTRTSNSSTLRRDNWVWQMLEKIQMDLRSDTLSVSKCSLLIVCLVLYYHCYYLMARWQTRCLRWSPWGLRYCRQDSECCQGCPG